MLVIMAYLVLSHFIAVVQVDRGAHFERLLVTSY